MSDLNNYSCTGRLGADAETRYLANGTAIWQCRLAVGYGYGHNAGTNWLRVSAFGKRAEGLAKLELTKGAQIGVTGELCVREYDRKDGTKGTSVEVNANDITLLGGKRDERAPSKPVKGCPQPDQGGFEDDDIPF
ncbi:MAG: single-stranded DNA-binding protein [Patescibacteria group bacterium]|nr:single-stranded DNA-binding protein [Patescibacteria group bacterium]